MPLRPPTLTPPRPQVLNEDLDEETLKGVLVECMRDAPGDAAEKEKKAGFLARLFNKRSNVEASPEEISLAAHYIIDRFGAKPSLEDLQAEENARRAGEAPLPVRRSGACGGSMEQPSHQLTCRPCTAALVVLLHRGAIHAAFGKAARHRAWQTWV